MKHLKHQNRLNKANSIAHRTKKDLMMQKDSRAQKSRNTQRNKSVNMKKLYFSS